MELNNSHLNNKSFFYKYLYSVLLFAINHIIYFWKMEIIFFFCRYNRYKMDSCFCSNRRKKGEN